MQTTNIVAQQLPNAATHTQQKYACALRSRSSKEAHAHIFLQWLMCCSRCLQSKWLQLSCAECWALDQIWIVLVKTRLCGFFPQEPGVRFLLQLLSSTFFFSHITKISATSDNVKNYVHPKPTSHALLRSAVFGAGSWARDITGCLWPTESSWGALRCASLRMRALLCC